MRRLDVDVDKLTREERAVLRAKAQLDAFDLRNRGTWYRSKDHDRMVLLGRLADAVEALADATFGPAPPEPEDNGVEPTDLARETIPEIEGLSRRHQGRRRGVQGRAGQARRIRHFPGAGAPGSLPGG